MASHALTRPLPHDGRSHRASGATARHPRHVVLATLLAVLAVLTMSALAGWHAAAFHDDPPAHALTVVAEAHAGDPSGDPDHAIHVAAHEIGHGVAVPSDAVAPLALSATGPAWPASESIAHAGVAPVGLLRPPQG